MCLLVAQRPHHHRQQLCRGTAGLSTLRAALLSTLMCTATWLRNTPADPQVPPVVERGQLHAGGRHDGSVGDSGKIRAEDAPPGRSWGLVWGRPLWGMSLVLPWPMEQHHLQIWLEQAGHSRWGRAMDRVRAGSPRRTQHLLSTQGWHGGPLRLVPTFQEPPPHPGPP